MAKRTFAQSNGFIDLDEVFRSPKVQKLYDAAAQNPDVAVRDPANIMDNWLKSSRALKEQRDSKSVSESKSWKARKALESITTPKASGKWHYYRDKTRKWIMRSPQKPHSIVQRTRELTLDEPATFTSKDGDKDISWLYHEFWLGGHKAIFIDGMYSKFQVENSIPEEDIWKVFQCLVAELIPADRLLPGVHASDIASPDTVWEVGKCMLQILTRGRFWDEHYNVLNPIDQGEKFGEYKHNVLQGQYKYSRSLLKIILQCLTYQEADRPTRTALLSHIHTILSVYDGSYKPLILDDPTQSYNPQDGRIPTGLTREEGTIYETLLNVVRTRKSHSALASKSHTPQVLIITDLAKDYDDLMAMIVLSEFHRLGIIRLVGFVANLYKPRDRALFGRGALDTLGLQDIPIGVGTKGEADIDDRVAEEAQRQNDEDPENFGLSNTPPILDHEYGAAKPFKASDDTLLPDGQELIGNILREQRHRSDYQRIDLLLISSLMDIGIFLESNEDLLAANIYNVVLQGGYSFTAPLAAEDPTKGSVTVQYTSNAHGGELTASDDAANNKFDMAHAHSFHNFLGKRKIKSTVFTKVATFATPIDTSLFLALEATGHPLGIYLRKTQVEQEKSFYARACSSNPFSPRMTQEWYIENKTGFYAAGHEPDEDFPVGDDVLPFLDRITAYDALAAVGVAGDDILQALKIPRSLVKRPDQHHSLHRVYGCLGADWSKYKLPSFPEEANLDGEKMALTIVALMKGALLASKQGLSS